MGDFLLILFLLKFDKQLKNKNLFFFLEEIKKYIFFFNNINLNSQTFDVVAFFEKNPVKK